MRTGRFVQRRGAPRGAPLRLIKIKTNGEGPHTARPGVVPVNGFPQRFFESCVSRYWVRQDGVLQQVGVRRRYLGGHHAADVRSGVMRTTNSLTCLNLGSRCQGSSPPQDVL